MVIPINRKIFVHSCFAGHFAKLQLLAIVVDEIASAR
jgi:hypothetical protein